MQRPQGRLLRPVFPRNTPAGAVNILPSSPIRYYRALLLELIGPGAWITGQMPDPLPWWSLRQELRMKLFERKIEPATGLVFDPFIGSGKQIKKQSEQDAPDVGDCRHLLRAHVRLPP